MAVEDTVEEAIVTVFGLAIVGTILLVFILIFLFLSFLLGSWVAKRLGYERTQAGVVGILTAVGFLFLGFYGIVIVLALAWFFQWYRNRQ